MMRDVIPCPTPTHVAWEKVSSQQILPIVPGSRVWQAQFDEFRTVKLQTPVALERLRRPAGGAEGVHGDLEQSSWDLVGALNGFRGPSIQYELTLSNYIWMDPISK